MTDTLRIVDPYTLQSTAWSWQNLINYRQTARLAMENGFMVSLGFGYVLELYNHWQYRNDNNLQDPNQRRDSFRDLYNNELGRLIAVIAVRNGWSDSQMADVVAEAVRRNVAIVDQSHRDTCSQRAAQAVPGLPE